MRHKEQGWRLRLHFYPVRGNGLGEEDSPHYHRWTLASKILAGGYLNRDHQEKTVASDFEGDENTYFKYKLLPSDQQTDSKMRKAMYMNKAIVPIVKSTIYARNDVRHFPVEVPHSVKTFPHFFGSTMTLAHTGKDCRENSYSF